MPEFTTTRRIAAPVEQVWDVLADFGDIQRWSPGVKASALTSDGPVGEGSTRHCEFAPFGAVDERIERFEPGRRMTIDLYETSKVPIAHAVADFELDPIGDGGTLLSIHYRYTPNLMGRLLKGTTDTQMRKAMSGMAAALERECVRHGPPLDRSATE